MEAIAYLQGGKYCSGCPRIPSLPHSEKPRFLLLERPSYQGPWVCYHRCSWFTKLENVSLPVAGVDGFFPFWFSVQVLHICISFSNFLGLLQGYALKFMYYFKVLIKFWATESHWGSETMSSCWGDVHLTSL